MVTGDLSTKSVNLVSDRMSYAHWALAAAFYAASVVLGLEILMNGEHLSGTLAAFMGAGATMFAMLPSFIQWQDRCLTKADDRARIGLATAAEAFFSELRILDERHQAIVAELAEKLGIALERAEEAEGRLAKMNQRPSAPRAKVVPLMTPPIPIVPLSSEAG
jgi:hypothetical protein